MSLPPQHECATVTGSQAKYQSLQCATNYGEVIEYNGGYFAYCVPNDVAESCIDESDKADCAGLGDIDCDNARTKAFEACVRVNALATCGQ